MNHFILLLLISITLISCKKENGKREYEMVCHFDSGDVFIERGKLFEQDKRAKKYLEQIGYGISMSKLQDIGIYMKLINNNTIIIKTNNNKIVGNDDWIFKKEGETFFANNQLGTFIGDIYLEGSYIQKGRAYSVENGTFEFYWRNAESYGMTDTILKGKWTLKRK